MEVLIYKTIAIGWIIAHNRLVAFTFIPEP